VARLYLNLKAEYFEQIKSGEKSDEYRLCTPYWTRRLVGRVFDGIVLKKGYPKAGDLDRIVERPWRGIERQIILHPHFGFDPVAVFAIKVNPVAEEPRMGLPV
jgi:hypothetical protein